MSLTLTLKGDYGVLDITILKRADDISNNYWDANWLICNIKIDIPHVKIDYNTNLRADEFQSFYNDLIFLQNTHVENNIAEYKSLENGISIKCKYAITGNYFCNINCEIMSNHDNWTEVSFKLKVDNWTMADFKNQLENSLKIYKVIGRNE